MNVTGCAQNWHKRATHAFESTHVVAKRVAQTGFAAACGPIIGLCNFTILHHRYPGEGLIASIAVATIGGVIGMYTVDFAIPWLRRKWQQ